MSIQAVAWALEQEDVPARPKLVLVSLANHANHTDGYCWLKAESIAKEASCKPRSVYRYVGDLIRNGYIRKTAKRGEDGRQRANDYWLLLNRAPAPWVSIGPAEDETDDANAAADEVGEAQDVASPHDSLTCGENAPPDDSAGIRPPAEKPPLSCGPADSGVSHKDSAEPSKTNPKIGARAGSYVPRAYRPPPEPPPQPLGSAVGKKAELIFVYEGTRAYEAWAKHRASEQGVTHWHLVRTKIVDGKSKTGWWFPSLFPPPADSGTHGGTGPPDTDPLAEEAAAEIKKTG